jgi:hypothetical protein
MRERGLLAAVLHQAFEDAIQGAPAEALPAYRWVLDAHPVMVAYCEFLDIAPDQFRARVLAMAGARCERLIRQAQELARAERSKREAGELAYAGTVSRPMRIPRL